MVGHRRRTLRLVILRPLFFGAEVEALGRRDPELVEGVEPAAEILIPQSGRRNLLIPRMLTRKRRRSDRMLPLFLPSCSESSASREMNSRREIRAKCPCPHAPPKSYTTPTIPPPLHPHNPPPD